MNEFELIQKFFTRNRDYRNDVVIGVGDDAAVVRVPTGHELVMTTDILVAGTHFPRDTPADAIGHKALAVNLSDLAAMGAEPAWFTMTLSLPEVNPVWLRDFAAGLFALADKYDVALVGGDTVKGPLSVGIQACGTVPGNSAVLRSGARVGDLVYVTGSLGDAAIGLECTVNGKTFDDDSRRFFRDRLNRPGPRVVAGMELRGIAHAMIDVSDGLAADLGHILRSSDVGATILLELLPLSSAYRKYRARLGWDAALSGGDDYELCFTVPAAKKDLVDKLCRDWQCGATCIGEIEQEPGLRILDGAGHRIEPVRSGHDHFSG